MACLCMACVKECAENSMMKAIDDIKSRSDYSSEGKVYLYSEGKVYLYWYVLVVNIGFHSLVYILTLYWIMTDARHDSTANAYHTTVVCISGR